MGIPLRQQKPASENNKEKKIKEIMKPLENLSSVSSDTKVKNAVYILKNSASHQGPLHNYLMVFENKTLIGFIGVRELLAAVQPPNLRDDWYRGWNVTSWAEPTFMQGLFTSLCLDVADKPVRDVIDAMTSTLRADSTLEEAVFKFYREKRDMFPVVEGDSLVGIVTADDVFTEMAALIS